MAKAKTAKMAKAKDTMRKDTMEKAMMEKDMMARDMEAREKKARPALNVDRSKQKCAGQRYAVGFDLNEVIIWNVIGFISLIHRTILNTQQI